MLKSQSQKPFIRYVHSKKSCQFWYLFEKFLLISSLLLYIAYLQAKHMPLLNVVYAQETLSQHQAVKKIQVKYIANQAIHRVVFQQADAKKDFQLRKNTFQQKHAHFLSWNTKADGTGISYTDQQMLHLNQSLTLYAQWEHEDGWFKEEGHWYYYQGHHKQKSGWLNLGQDWYYLDLQTGQASCNGIYQLPFPPFLTNEQSKDKNLSHSSTTFGYFLFDDKGRLSTKQGLYTVERLKVVTKKGNQYLNQNTTIWLDHGEVVTYPGLVQQNQDYYYFPQNYFKKLLAQKSSGMIKNRWFYVAKTNGLAYPTSLGVGNFDSGQYYFNRFGKMQLYDGILRYKKQLYYLNKGCRKYNGIIQLDNHYYYVTSSGRMLTSGNYFIQKTNQLLPVGYYSFDASGKIKLAKQQAIQSLTKHLTNESNAIKANENQYGLIQKDGSYFYFDHNGKLICNQDYYIAQTNQLLPQGKYHFDLSGKLIGSNQTVNGIVKETEADWFYYENGVRTYAGLIEIAGNYYYVNSECRVIHQQNYYISKTNGLLPQATYEFNQEGCLVQKNVQKNGIEKESDGHWYYYQAGLKTYAGVIKIGNDYYYVNSHYEVLHDTVAYVSKTNQFIPSGDYRFDNEGRIILTKSS